MIEDIKVVVNGKKQKFQQEPLYCNLVKIIQVIIDFPS